MTGLAASSNYEEFNHLDAPASTEHQPPSRRWVLRTGTAAIVGTIFDQGLGRRHASTLRDQPEIEIIPGKADGPTTVIAPGFINDGKAVAWAMAHKLSRLGPIAAIRYAETNMEIKPIASALSDALVGHKLAELPLNFYGGSMGGMVLARVLQKLSARNFEFNALVLDSAPAHINNIRAINLMGIASRLYLEKLSYSRLLNMSFQLGANLTTPPALDRAPSTPLVYAESHRRAIVETDSITARAQIEFMRGNPVEAGSLAFLGLKHVIHARPPGRDPLIDNVAAAQQWQRAFTGGQTNFIPTTDLAQPWNAHGNAVLYPAGVFSVLEHLTPERAPRERAQ